MSTIARARRTLPYIRAWAQKYRAQGLVVLGVHTPEFDFEKDPGNVLRAVRDLKIDYPMAVDSKQALWHAFGTRAWRPPCTSSTRRVASANSSWARGATTRPSA
jgi:thiol-disulfide isomerase/thioredoxin